MSYVQPDSIIKLCKGVGVDPSYTNTVYFSSDTARYNYFNSKAVQTHTAQSYANISDGVLRIGTKYELIYDCDYIMFQNTSFGNKWFYGFITDIKRLNGGSVTGRCDVHFEIDCIQTYFKSSDLEQCFVLREHTATDNVGDNITNEKIPLGDYIRNEAYGDFEFQAKYVYAQINTSLIGELVGLDRGTDIGTSYDGNTYYYLGVLGSKPITEMVKDISIGAIPNIFADIISIIIAPIPNTSNKTVFSSFSFNKKISGQLDGYTPKNKKLYTYPYNYCEFCSTSGLRTPIRYEFVSSDNVTIQYQGALSNTSGFNFYIQNYEIANPILPVNMGVTCNFNKDFSVQKVAQTLANVGLNMLSTSASPTEKNIQSTSTYREYASDNTRKLAGKSTITEDVTESVSGGDGSASKAKAIAGEIGTLLSYGVTGQGYDTNTLGALFGVSNLVWISYNCQPAQILMQIDDYFTRYGYAVNRLKTPNINARPHWTYVQTQDCAVKTNAPKWARDRIAQSFNNGITWWKNASEIGNFSLDNSV